MFLFILCSLASWICPIPEPQPNIIAQQLSDSYNIIGNPWNDISDPGYCGYSLPSGSGNPPTLSWPVAPNLNHNRSFRITHPAIDIYANEGDAVRAAAPGTVIWAGWSTFGGGNVVVISHGSWYTTYFHLSEVGVICGEWVEGIIGTVGDTGAVTKGYFHLHFYLGNGNRAYDPIPYLS